MPIPFHIIQVALIHTDPVSERTPTELNVCSIRNRALRERGAIVLKTAFRVTLIFFMSNLCIKLVSEQCRLKYPIFRFERFYETPDINATC